MGEKSKQYDVAIIGAGLSGLATALLLQEAGKRVCVLEARAEAGGRIRSVTGANGEFIADLGPSWVWPMHQPVISRWLAKLDLETIPQFSEGQSIMDFGPDQATRLGFIPSQEGNERVAGGSKALIDALVANIAPERLFVNTQVSSVEAGSDQVTIETYNPDYPEIIAVRLVCALPPRIAATGVNWKTPLDPVLADALSATPTWMAPHAKVAVVYEDAFWRKQGLSGRIVSRAGPIVEAHDHCGPEGSPAALWGFIGWPFSKRVEMAGGLEEAVRAQLHRCFGQNTPQPVSIHIKDWAKDPMVAHEKDLTGPADHPSVRPEIIRQPQMDGRLFFAGSETATTSPGLIEGAFDAAERVVGQVTEGQYFKTS